MATVKTVAGTLLKLLRYKMNIPEITKTTAKNMYELMMQLANHIETLEAENAELKQKLEAHNAESK